jgi:hypothetical protein
MAVPGHVQLLFHHALVLVLGRPGRDRDHALE